MLGSENKIGQKMDLNPLFLAKTKFIIIPYYGFHKKYEIPLKRVFFSLYICFARCSKHWKKLSIYQVSDAETLQSVLCRVYGLIPFKT